MLLQMAKFHSFLQLSGSPLYVYVYIWVCVYTYLISDEYLGCFHILVTVNNAAMNIEVQVSF